MTTDQATTATAKPHFCRRKQQQNKKMIMKNAICYQQKKFKKKVKTPKRSQVRKTKTVSESVEKHIFVAYL